MKNLWNWYWRVLICMFFISVNVDGAEKSGSINELKTVKKVALERYLGKWYEIATIKQSFQKKCAGGTTAVYTLREDGDISVLNRCYTDKWQVVEAKGRAWVVDRESNAKLKVSFIPWIKLNFLAGDYWIIGLGPSYEYAVVGHPSRKYGWILSRSPELPEPVLRDIIKMLESQGYDFSRFSITDQKDFVSEK